MIMVVVAVMSYTCERLALLVMLPACCSFSIWWLTMLAARFKGSRAGRRHTAASALRLLPVVFTGSFCPASCRRGCLLLAFSPKVPPPLTLLTRTPKTANGNAKINKHHTVWFIAQISTNMNQMGFITGQLVWSYKVVLRRSRSPGIRIEKSCLCGWADGTQEAAVFTSSFGYLPSKELTSIFGKTNQTWEQTTFSQAFPPYDSCGTPAFVRPVLPRMARFRQKRPGLYRLVITIDWRVWNSRMGSR